MFFLNAGTDYVLEKTQSNKKKYKTKCKTIRVIVTHQEVGATNKTEGQP